MFRKVPLIVILGSTGTGKTKLSIELCERFGGEIISADSMQVYANLNIATAKASKEEQLKVRHHLLDVAHPSAEPFTAFNFQSKALPIINNLLENSKKPIIVGGTTYYIESLLWNILIQSTNTRNNDNDGTSSGKQIRKRKFDEISTDILYEDLKKIDPISANRLHPNNKRKIVRALEVFEQTGKRLSTILNEQRNKPGGNRLGGPLRYPHTIIFWLRCNQEILDRRLDKRVDSMLEQGILNEIREFYNINVKDSSETKLTKGILQTIGFKEFLPYLREYDSTEDQIIDNYLKTNSFKIPADKSDQPKGLTSLLKCLDELKLVTRRYSKQQIKWIRNRFLASSDRQVPPVYGLDTSDTTQWYENVTSPAVEIINSYIDEKECAFTPMESFEHPCNGLNEDAANFCETCQRHFVGEFQWLTHLRSNKHKRCKESLRKRKLAEQTQLNTV